MLNTASMTRRQPRSAFALFLVLFVLVAFGRAGAQQLRMIAPTGGENLVVDSTFNIRWLVQGVTGTLRVEYSIDSGSTWKLIDTATAVTGFDTLAWKIPNEPTQNAMIRVWKSDSISGRTRRVFHIVTKPVKVVRILAPNGGELFAVDSVTRIRWTTQNISGPMEVSYSADSGKTWNPIGTANSNSGPGEIDTLVWKVPNDTTRNAFVRVMAVDSTSFDLSDRSFTIKGHVSPKITLFTPNGGEVFAGDSTMTIRWTGADLTGAVRVEYSADNGATWTAIGFRQSRNGPDTTTWKINSKATTTALVRVMLGTSQVGDTSDAVFTVGGTLPDTLALLYPNAGGVFTADTTIKIRWMAQGITQNIVVSYSVDGGLRWTQISSVTPHNGIDSLTWTVPSDTTSRAYIRVATLDQTRLVKSAIAFSIVLKNQDTTTSAVREITSSGAADLAGALPNPTTGRTEIRWNQHDVAQVSCDLYGADGRLLRSIDAGRREAGAQSLSLDLDDLTPGIYHLQVHSAAGRASVAVVIVR